MASQTIAFAYPSPPATAKVTAGCANVVQGNNCTYTFEFMDSGGNGIDGLAVTFALDPLTGCSLSPTGATTSGGGFVSTTLTCASDASGSGAVVATSTTASVSASAAVNVNPANAGGGGTLPFTSSNPPGPNGWLIAGLTLAGAIVLAGAGYLTLNRRRRTPA